MRAFLLAFLTAVSIVFATQPALAEKAEVYTGLFSETAVQGYDTVAYFTEGKPVKGTDQFTTDYKGATWKFVSQENLEAFLASPDMYAPQYGGYCAWAVALGQTAKGDARQWHIADGKLYLNLSSKIKRQWLDDVDNKIIEADANWPSVIE
ncbi:MAG: YHS domain-containing (seleno)protein [Pseudomonadota bacterium]